MSSQVSKAKKADYGLDAPGVVRNLLVIGAVGLLTWGTAALGLWSGRLFVFDLASIGLASGLALTATGLYMIYVSKIGKARARERLLDLVSWKAHGPAVQGDVQREPEPRPAGLLQNSSR